MAVIDYATFRRICPRRPDETEEQFRQRCTQDGLARFTTKTAMRNLLAYRELTENCEKIRAHVVLVPEPEPQFRQQAGFTFDVEASIAERDLVITRQQYRDAEVRALMERKANAEGRNLVVEDVLDANNRPVEDDRVITVTPQDARDPQKWQAARDRALKARKPIRISSEG